MLQFGYLCRLFGLFLCSNTNNPFPCSTDAIGVRQPLPTTAPPQDPMLVLQFLLPALNHPSSCTALSPSDPPNQSSLPSLTLQAILNPHDKFYYPVPFFSSDYLPLQAIFEPKRQVLWSSPLIPRQITCPSKKFSNGHAKLCDPVLSFSSDYLPLQSIFEPTHQVLWASTTITHHITFPFKPFSNRCAKRCEPVLSFSSYYMPLQPISKLTRQAL